MRRITIGMLAMLAVVLASSCNQSAVPAGGTASPSTSVSSVNTDTSSTETQAPADPIRAAIQAHLAHRGNLNLQSFDTEVKQVSIQGDHAQADVEFHVKGGPGVMQLTYQLEKRDNAWSVVESVPATSNFSHPPLDGSAATTNGSSPSASPLSDPTGFFNGATTRPPPQIH
jgi:hypothetical protein